MNKIKRVIFIILACIIFVAGCIEEEGITPTETPISTTTPGEIISTPTPGPTPMPTPEVWEPEVTLKPGYKWYQDDEFGYGFCYPEDWEKNNLALTKGIENGAVFGSESSTKYGAADAMVCVLIYSDPKEFKFWEKPGFIENAGFEKVKELGLVSKYGNITLNGRTGFEVIYNPFVGFCNFSAPIPDDTEPMTPTWTQRTVVFTIDDLDYVILVTSSNKFYNKYNDTYENIINSFIIKD